MGYRLHTGLEKSYRSDLREKNFGGLFSLVNYLYRLEFGDFLGLIGYWWER